MLYNIRINQINESKSKMKPYAKDKISYHLNKLNYAFEKNGYKLVEVVTETLGENPEINLHILSNRKNDELLSMSEERQSDFNNMIDEVLDIFDKNNFTIDKLDYSDNETEKKYSFISRKNNVVEFPR